MNITELIEKYLPDSYFDHELLSRSYELAHRYALSPNPDLHVEVIGPTGAGKSTLRRLLELSLVPPVAEWPVGQVPMLSVRASNTDDGYFSSKDFYKRIAVQLGDPFRTMSLSGAEEAGDLKCLDRRLDEILSDPLWRRVHVKETGPEIRIAAERLAIARGVKFLLVDEAHVMGMVKRNREGISHLESLRAFADKVGCKLIIFGTYYLLEAWEMSAELGRRLPSVHLRRYDDEDQKELNEFGRCCRKLGTSFGIQDDLVKENIRFIYDLTLGNVGEAHDLFERAQVIAQAGGKSAAAKDDLVSAMHPERKLQTMYSECLVGEVQLAAPTKSFLKGLKTWRKAGAEGWKKAAKGKISRDAKAKKRRGNRRPGRRNPKRDKVGL